MSGKKRRLGRHDDRPGSSLTLCYLWRIVPATEVVHRDDDAFSDETWTYYAHQIARESDHPHGVPDPRSALGPPDSNEEDGSVDA